MARKNTKKHMQPQPQPTPQQLPPQSQQPSSQQLPQQQQQPVPTWSPPKDQQQQQQQASEPDLFGEEFFSQPPAAHAAPAIDLHWDDLDVPRIAPDKRRAMLATIAIFSVFAVAVGGFIIYTQMIMPTPVALGASSGTMMIPEAAPYVEPVIDDVRARRAVPPPVPAPIDTAPAPIDDVSTPVVQPPIVSAPVEAGPIEAGPVIDDARARSAVPLREPVVHAPVVRPRRTAPAPVANDSLSAQAMRMLNTGHAADARRLAQQAVQSNPERAEGWIVLGAANASLGDSEAAKTAYANCTARASGPRVATCRALAR